MQNRLPKYILMTLVGCLLSASSVFAADWTSSVSQLLRKHGYRLPVTRGAKGLRALQLDAQRPVSKDQYNLIDYSWEHNRHLDFPNTIDAKASEIPLPASSLDVIFGNHTVEMFEPQAFLIEADRLLRPGGVFFLTFEDHPPSAQFLMFMGSDYEVKNELSSTNEFLFRSDKSSYLAQLWGWSMIEFRPGELPLPNAPTAYGIAFIKPLNAALAEKQVLKPQWNLPKEFTDFVTRNPDCTKYLTKGVKLK